METSEEMGRRECPKQLQKNLDSYFSSPEVTLNRTLNKSCHSPESKKEFHIIVHASTVAVAAVANLKTIPSLATEVEIGFSIAKCKVAPIEKNQHTQIRIGSRSYWSAPSFNNHERIIVSHYSLYTLDR